MMHRLRRRSGGIKPSPAQSAAGMCGGAGSAEMGGCFAAAGNAECICGGKMMKRCKICKGLGDVRSDGICSCCYDARMAGQFGMSYGKFVALYGHNFLRRDYLPERRRQCPVCGRDLPLTAGRKRVFCSRICAYEMGLTHKKEGRTGDGLDK